MVLRRNLEHYHHFERRQGVYDVRLQFAVQDKYRTPPCSASSVTLPTMDNDLILLPRFSSTYDHRSVEIGHLVRNHEVSIVFVVLGTSEDP
jgi:hypothetical protein